MLRPSSLQFLRGLLLLKDFRGCLDKSLSGGQSCVRGEHASFSCFYDGHSVRPKGRVSRSYKPAFVLHMVGCLHKFHDVPRFLFSFCSMGQFPGNRNVNPAFLQPSVGRTSKRVECQGPSLLRGKRPMFIAGWQI